MDLILFWSQLIVELIAYCSKSIKPNSLRIEIMTTVVAPKVAVTKVAGLGFSRKSARVQTHRRLLAEINETVVFDH